MCFVASKFGLLSRPKEIFERCLCGGGGGGGREGKDKLVKSFLCVVVVLLLASVQHADCRRKVLLKN